MWRLEAPKTGSRPVWRQVWKPERIRNAAQHAAEHRGVAPLDENVDFTPAPPDTTI